MRQLLFRVKSSGSGINCALFEADGSKWKNVCQENIKKYLVEKLPKEMTVIA